MKKLIGLILLFGWGTAWAIPVTWTLDNVVFDDGGEAYGSFIYDADTGDFSSIDIITTLGSDLPGTQYTSWSWQSDAESLLIGEYDYGDYPAGKPAFGIGISSAMTNAGGYLSIVGTEGYCADGSSSYLMGNPNLRSLVSGNITAVPIPAAFWLFISALVAIWSRRHKIVAT